MIANMATENVKRKAKSSKKITTVKTTAMPHPVEDMTIIEERDSAKPLYQRPRFIAVVVILIILAVVFYFKSLILAATVNGQPIFRISVIKSLEQQSGKQALNDLITKSLVYQEAKKRNIVINDTEVNNQIKTVSDSLSQQGQKLDDALKAQGLTKADLQDRIRLQLIVQKIVGNSIVVTNKEIDDYINANQASIPPDANLAQVRTQVANQLKQQKLSQKAQSLIADLQKNAKINYFIQY